MTTAILLMVAVGLICGIILAVGSVCMAVKTNEKQAAIRDCLPGANCGSCGFAGCDAYAEALANVPGTKTNLCIPGADKVSHEISQLMGVPFEDVVEQVAFVKCMGGCNTAKNKYEYKGIASCSAANMLFGGKKQCTMGCLGFGDCAAVCPQGAICIENGIAHVDTRKCTGCGLCAKKCPNHLIVLMPDKEKVVVSCSNTEKGAQTHAECANGCIACHKCEKNCPEGAITIENDLCKIDYSKCVNCGTCAKVCPVGCIKISDNTGIHRYIGSAD